MTDQAPQPTASPRGTPWRTFLQVILTLVTGFSLPVFACYGLILVASFSLNSLAGSVDSSGGSSGFGTGDAVAIVRVEGPIVSSAGPFDVGIASAERITANIERAASDSSVKAVVLVVNSPGGGVNASDLIYHELTQLDKPIVVSMGDLAASGGYYVSAPGDWIIANPNTLTGSIGVISQFIEISELLDEQGIEVTTFTTGDHKDTGSFSREITEEERVYWQTILDETYDSFVAIVAAGRNMDEASVRELADGSVYTGRQALDNGLVDALGYEEDAIAKAAELGGISGEPRIVEYVNTPDFNDFLTGFATPRDPLSAALALMEQFTTPSLEMRWIGP